MVRAALTATILLGCAAAQAQAPAPGLYSERSINAALAQDAVNAAVEACAGRGHRITAVVVDRSGIMKAMLRADGAGPHGVWAARAKAYTAVSTRIGTTQLLDAVRANPGASRLPDVEGFLILGGGLPIRAGDEVVGGIGVDGAPGGLLDDQCAEAGIARIRDRLG